MEAGSCRVVGTEARPLEILERERYFWREGELREKEEGSWSWREGFSGEYSWSLGYYGGEA